MEKRVGLLILMIYLMGFISTSGMTKSAISEKSANSEIGVDLNEEEEEVCCAISGALAEAEPNYRISKKSNCGNIEGLMDINKEIVNDSFCKKEIKERIKINESQIKKLVNKTNKIHINKENESCPDRCTCSGSVTKCYLKNGTREMTITAGNSGNIIIQTKGINSSTNVTLYKSEDGKIYAVNEKNKTKEVRMFPDQVREKIREKFSKELENETIELDENGTYNYQARNKVKLFGLFKIKMKVKAKIDAESGNITKVNKPWWSFLAKEDKSNILVGTSCGTVTPGYNDKCCEEKGYDFWNNETSTCEFVVEEANL